MSLNNILLRKVESEGGRIAQGAGIDAAAPGDCSSARRLSEAAGVDAIHAGHWRRFC